jgi:hypothetical protein
MSKTTLYNIFHDNIENLINLLNNEDRSETKKWIEKQEDDNKVRIELAQILVNDELFTKKESDIINDKYFRYIMEKHPYKVGINILSRKLDSEQAAISYLIIILEQFSLLDCELEQCLLNLKNKFGFIWLINTLLEIRDENFEDTNIENNLYSLPILKYIGRPEEFLNKLRNWYENYKPEANPEEINRGYNYSVETTYNMFLRNIYMEMIIKYMPYISGLTNLYIQFSKLKLEDYSTNTNFENNITKPLKKILY